MTGSKASKIRFCFASIFVAIVMLVLLASCANKQVALKNLAIMREEASGSILLDISIDDFNQQGFAYGDSLNINFSNGYHMKDIPYYNGYYTALSDPLVVGYPGSKYVKVTLNCGDGLWDSVGLSDGDTATVLIEEREAYLSTQETFNISYSKDRGDYKTDEQFANFRTARGGTMAENVLYRSASPIDNRYDRVPYVSALAQKTGIAYVLDLSDSPEEVEKDVAADAEQDVDVSFFTGLRDEGRVAMLNLSASYPSEKYATTLAGGLVDLLDHDGPYLVHCVEGKDRTGFVCILLEALCGASYDELQADYMETYDNYYGITRESDSSRYEAISSLYFDGMLSFLAGADGGADLTSLSYTQYARDYLSHGGMTDEQIDALVAKLTC